MKTDMLRNRKSQIAIFLVVLLVVTTFVVIPSPSRASGPQTSAVNFDPYRRSVPNVDVNSLAAATRQPTSAQVAALDGFKGSYGEQAIVRWNPFAGSPDVMMGFHTAPSSDTPENTARAFVAANSNLFGVSAAQLRLVDEKQAFGGYLLRFQQAVGDVEVAGGGLGFLMNSEKQIRMVMGSTFRDADAVQTSTTALTGALASQTVQADLARYAVNWPSGAEQIMAPALDRLTQEVAPVLREPRLNIYPTADGYRVAWNVITFSRNPFGMFITQVDASNGQILARENLVRYQNETLPYTADIFPSTPKLANPDTGEYKKDATGAPEGLLRVQLRSFNPGTNATGVNGTLSGPHALVQNVLATKQPFAQSALGTFHFRNDNAPLEAQPNEADDLAEPAEHFDTSNLFFFINYLVEYINDIHRRGDSVHSPIGQGDFPDNYQNSDRPLVGLSHFPNTIAPTLGGSAPDTTSPDTILRSIAGFDNAFSLPVIQTVDTPAGPQKIVVNPTVYGHGYLFNDLGKDGPVAYHEGMHSISTPIAGLEGGPEGSAMNEGQADLWAYTITGAEAIGEYGVQGARIRALFRSQGRDPNSLAWIRSVHTTLKYSELGTRGNPAAFEEHRDGEIYVAAMHGVRELMIAAEPQMQFKRPAFLDGQPTRSISRGQESWERIFLGSLYLLGLTAPDTFVKARDSFIMADRILYPTDASDLDAPGQHEALIWQVFASHEIGVNAAAPIGGRQTISTAVPEFALAQNHVAAPQGVILEPASTTSVRVSWQPSEGAVAYEVFKRKSGTAGQRQFKGVTGREYFDGDNATTGWSHVSYVTLGTSYEDKGAIAEFFAPVGIKNTNESSGFNQMFDTEYAVRALNVNPNKQFGASDLSGSASLNSGIQDVSSAIQATVSNMSFANGVFEFDQTLRNNGVNAADRTAFAPINFKIVSISHPSVTVANADNGGDGRSVPATFVYNETLAAGATSTAHRLKFNDPQAQLFTFDALVTARVRGASIAANGRQPYDGDGGGRAPIDLSSVTDTYTGTILLGSGGNVLVNGVDYLDVPFVAKEGAFGVQGRLNASPVSAGAYPDLDFELRDDQGHVLDSSGNLGPVEDVSAGITPGRTYIYRVIGYGNGPTQIVITSEQFILNGSGGAQQGGGNSSFQPATTGVNVTRRVRFTVNPLTRAVSFRIL
jgi:hypothetical protein